MQAMTMPVVSAITAGVLIIGQMGLMFAVVGQRRRAQQSLGDGGDAALLRATRRHGNYAENAAIFVIGLALAETMGSARLLIVALAVVFVAARLAHAIGLSRADTVNPWRVGAIVANIAAGLVLGVRLVLLGVAHLGG